MNFMDLPVWARILLGDHPIDDNRCTSIGTPDTSPAPVRRGILSCPPERTGVTPTLTVKAKRWRCGTLRCEATP